MSKTSTLKTAGLILISATALLAAACSSGPRSSQVMPAPTVQPTQQHVAPTSTNAPIATPTAAATATPEPQQTLRVGNTEGQGVYLRRTPTLGDRLGAYPDQTELHLVGPDASGDGINWHHVVAPDGVVGYVPEHYAIEVPVDPESAPASVSTGTPTPAGANSEAHARDDSNTCYTELASNQWTFHCDYAGEVEDYALVPFVAKDGLFDVRAKTPNSTSPGALVGMLRVKDPNTILIAFTQGRHNTEICTYRWSGPHFTSRVCLPNHRGLLGN